MANGWAPRNGEEMVNDIYQRLRHANRNPRWARYLGEIPGAIDGSAGHDVAPLSDEYIEGLNEGYPEPQLPSADAAPPAFEDTSPLDDPSSLADLATSGSMDATSSTITTPSGFKTYSDWTIFNNGIGATTSGDFISVPTGVYIAQVKLNGSISPVQTDLVLGLNLFSPSAYVSQEFPLVQIGTSQPGRGYSAGPWPVLTAADGQLSVSVYFATSGTPTVTGTCTLLLTRLG